MTGWLRRWWERIMPNMVSRETLDPFRNLPEDEDLPIGELPKDVEERRVPGLKKPPHRKR